eukprot:XP_001705779.1 Hypothetical protein GL50803_89178 [Giardia lamblia ATCC 50803]
MATRGFLWHASVRMAHSGQTNSDGIQDPKKQSAWMAVCIPESAPSLVSGPVPLHEHHDRCVPHDGHSDNQTDYRIR